MKSGAEVFRLHGRRMVAVWTRPEPERRSFPAVLFLHGFPGSEKNVDIQRALLKKGVASLALHFQGAWGSEGTYRFTSLVDQARAGLRFMAGLPGVDRKRLAVFGFSMGGWAALHVAAKEAAVKAAAAVAPAGASVMLRGDGSAAWNKIKRGARALRVGSEAALKRDFVRAVATQDAAVSAARLKVPLLLVHGMADEVIPPAVSRHIFSLAAGPKRLVLMPGAAHDFLEQREELARLVAGWLASRLR